MSKKSHAALVTVSPACAEWDFKLVVYGRTVAVLVTGPLCFDTDYSRPLAGGLLY